MVTEMQVSMVMEIRDGKRELVKMTDIELMTVMSQSEEASDHPVLSNPQVLEQEEYRRSPIF